MGIWLNEKHTDGYSVSWGVREIIHSEKTRYQDLAIVDTLEWGKALLLDGIIQTTDKDEFIYHEMIAHVAMMTHPAPERVLIIGGGDGGALREVLKYDTVVKVDLVEIDERVIENCRLYFPAIACGFSDNRANIIIEDGLKYVKKTGNRYDVVIIDSSDPIGPAIELFGEQFYRDVQAIMQEDGLMVAQAESPFFFSDAFTKVFHNMKTIFSIAHVYLACVPTYVSGFWAFAIGSRSLDPQQIGSARKPVAGLKYYTPEIHQASFVLPPFIRAMIMRDGQ